MLKIVLMRLNRIEAEVQTMLTMMEPEEV
jgi:hypothetical protein